MWRSVMEGGLLTKTYFLAGRAVRISGDGVLAVATAPVRAASWAKQQVASSARLLNPFRRAGRKGGHRSRKSSPPRAAVLEARRSTPPRDTTAMASASEAPQPAQESQHPDALRRLHAEIQGMDPASEVAIVKVIADAEATRYKVADTAPPVSRIPRGAPRDPTQVASGGGLSEVAYGSDEAERPWAGEEDAEAPPAEASRTSRPKDRKGASHAGASKRSAPRRHAAPPEVTQAEASAAVFEGSREKLVFHRALSDLTRGDETARARAVRDLGGIHHELSARAVAARLSRDRSANVRRECVNALTAIGGTDALSAAKRALSDASTGVRLAAVRGVYRLAGPDGAALLVRMFADGSEDVRRRAISCAGWLGQEHLAAALIPLLGDECAFVRSAALDALANLKSTQAVEEIIDVLDDPDESVARKASEALETITGKQMAEAFPEDDYGRRLLIARWKTRQEVIPWLSES